MVGAERANMSQAWPAGTLGFVVSERRYAGFWKRFAAYLIDFILLYIVEGVLAVGVVMMSPHEINVVGILYGVINFQLVSAAIAWAYFALFESSPMQGTVGKYAMGIYVTDRHGDPIGFWRATARYWLKPFSTLTLMVGWIMAAFTPRKQALHDLIAGTLVFSREERILPTSDPADINLDEYWDGKRWVNASTLPPAGG
jgi:uncharacterized RDD family membrane protein YckC